MGRLFGAALVLGLSLAAGSWVGLGRPPPEEARAFVEALARPLLSRAPPTPPRSASDDAPRDFGPLPQETDPSSVPGMTAWPRLNVDASIARAWVVSEGPHHEPGDGRRLVTLTFDDGPFLETTPTVLKLLAREKLHATFFVVGQYLDGTDRRAAATRRLLQRVVAAGHLVGNHTHDHARLSMRPPATVIEQIDEGAASIERAIGKRPIFFRPPFGELDDFGERAVRERGLDLILWNVEANDMVRDDSHRMFREIAQQLEHKEGGVVLLHDIRFSSVAVLRELLPWLHEHRWDPKRPDRVGYEVVDLPTYLRAVADSPQPYETRPDLEKARDQRAKLRRAHPDAPAEG